jgi:DNA topoisomerase-1
MATASIPPSGLHAPQILAKEAQLRYVSDAIPGIRRKRMGKGFSYLDPEGRRITDPEDRERIEQLAIPPAWTDVWICPLAHGHLQATGRDERGRKQYLYHARWQEATNRTKFDRMLLFGRALPKIRQQIHRDMALKGLSKRRVVATVVELLDQTAMRVGNEEYARENESFGITTLRDHHVDVKGETVRFRFRGKGGKLLEVGVSDRRLARVVRSCEEIPGQELFQYEDAEGAYRVLESNDVNEYLREITQQPFTAKDFRTWRASSLVAEAIYRRLDGCPSKTEAKRIVSQAIREASESLGNTVSTCRKYYVHPSLAELFLAGELSALCNGFKPRSHKWMGEADQILLHVLKRLPRPGKQAA